MKPVSLKFTDRTQDQIATLSEHYETTNTDIILSAIENLLDAHDAGTLDNAQQTRKSVSVRYPRELWARMRDAKSVYGYSSFGNVVEAAIDYAMGGE